ncbi:MAG TPA: hypothetical protein DGT23_21500 [Micromonosporaceae bacterium]|nr:hypothetical protein [Micromonosporaceae bacterium]
MTVNGRDDGGGLEWLVEHRYRAVLQVLEGAPVAVAARQAGASRQSLYSWLARYEADGLAGLHLPGRGPGMQAGHRDRRPLALRRYGAGGVPAVGPDGLPGIHRGADPIRSPFGSVDR